MNPAPVDGCRGELTADAQGIDTVRAGIQRGVCSTARFVDRVFGRENQFSEYEDESSGRAGVTLGWDEQDGFEVDTRFRASVNLPQINERFNATIGRATSDEYLADESGVVQPGGRRLLRRRPGRVVRRRRLPRVPRPGQPLRSRCRRQARVAAQPVRQCALPPLHLRPVGNLADAQDYGLRGE